MQIKRAAETDVSNIVQLSHALFQEDGAEIMTVTAYAANQSAVNFYQSLGFTPKQITLALKL